MFNFFLLLLSTDVCLIHADQACHGESCPPKVNSLLQVGGRSTDIQLATVNQALVPEWSGCSSSNECVRDTWCRDQDRRCLTDAGCDWANWKDATTRNCTKIQRTQEAGCWTGCASCSQYAQHSCTSCAAGYELTDIDNTGWGQCKGLTCIGRNVADTTGGCGASFNRLLSSLAYDGPGVVVCDDDLKLRTESDCTGVVSQIDSAVPNLGMGCNGRYIHFENWDCDDRIVELNALTQAVTYHSLGTSGCPGSETKLNIWDDVASTVDDCAALCSATSGCVSFGYRTTKQCHLRAEVFCDANAVYSYYQLA